jgi:F0F1-type ATP synthase membrane subunit b/b'
MAVILLFLLAAGLFVWGVSLQSRLRKLKDKLRPIASAELYAKTVQRNADSELARAREEAAQIIGNAKANLSQARGDADSELARAREEAAQIIGNAKADERIAKESCESDLGSARDKAALIVDNARKESSQLRKKIDSLRAEAKAAKEELELLNDGLRLKADDAHLLEVGYYQPVYGFEDLEKFQQQLNTIKESQKAMLRVEGASGSIEAAAYATHAVSYNGSEAKGRKLLTKVLKLMMRAFNGECDSYIARVSYKNISIMEKRIEASFSQINKIAETWHCELNAKYLANRLSELRLVYEYAELQEKIKREQAAIREQMREEERAAREAERVQKQIEDERKKYEDQLASENDRAKIKELQAIIESLNARSRAISQAQLTRAGNVYILSNVGSFGENVFKIGMTRRLDPEDRVKELGDASVPFPFDVHAMIDTPDAPALERALHNHFDRRRLNLENDRKEFFRLTIEEIREELRRLKDDLGIESEIRLSLLAEAKEYRMSEAKRKHLQGGDG